ncbi:MAG: small ribosomal subunit Rsm22 family protein [Verrucomicrobiae bacterium]|nr:small ribosomal subunit Rsm22 family protein [Verrucomicrobiae bacterium]
MNWEQLDWEVLDRLRAQFLRGGKADYWRSRTDLEQYDQTFGQRIAWKWAAVLAELARLGWRPPGETVLDWGCGSGVAGRCVRDFFGLRTLWVHDRSPLAVRYACEAGRAEPWRGQPPGLLVLSHVLNEIEPRDVYDVIRQAEAVIWVEPGTHQESRALIAQRERWRDEFFVVAPCSHRERCGLLARGQERHWCHFFAEPPAGVMADANWVRFAKRAGIDLRALPYSYLVLDRRPVGGATGARVIGRPRLYKGFAKVLLCDVTGVRDEPVARRDERFKTVQAGGVMPLPPAS